MKDYNTDEFKALLKEASDRIRPAFIAKVKAERADDNPGPRPRTYPWNRGQEDPPAVG